jgi:hypothetical protein
MPLVLWVAGVDMDDTFNLWRSAPNKLLIAESKILYYTRFVPPHTPHTHIHTPCKHMRLLFTTRHDSVYENAWGLAGLCEWTSRSYYQHPIPLLRLVMLVLLLHLAVS